MLRLPSTALTSHKSPYQVLLKLPIRSTAFLSSVWCPSRSAVGTPVRKTMPSWTRASRVSNRAWSSERKRSYGILTRVFSSAAAPFHVLGAGTSPWSGCCGFSSKATRFLVGTTLSFAVVGLVPGVWRGLDHSVTRHSPWWGKSWTP